VARVGECFSGGKDTIVSISCHFVLEEGDAATGVSFEDIPARGPTSPNDEATLQVRRYFPLSSPHLSHPNFVYLINAAAANWHTTRTTMP
jgi:hypothetical protein